MMVDERDIEFEIVEVVADASTGKMVVDAIGRGGRFSALKLRQTYNSGSTYSRARLKRLLGAARIAVDDGGGFVGTDLVGARFVADVAEDARLGFYWYAERPSEMVQ